MSRGRSFVKPLQRPDHEPDLAPELKAAIIEALRQAWKRLRARNLAVIRSGEEEAITHALERILNEHDPATGRRAISELDLFEWVGREASVTSAGGGYKKAPDLVFRPTAAVGVRFKSDWGFWVEAKIVDGQTHPLRLYESQGVERFATGQYAPRMPCGAIAAYVRDGSRPAKSFNGNRKLKFVPGAVPDSGTSRHDRSRQTPALVQIVLTHLWLDAA